MFLSKKKSNTFKTNFIALPTILMSLVSFKTVSSTIDKTIVSIIPSSAMYYLSLDNAQVS